MCWTDPGELYNDGSAFKICHRTLEGVMVTVICDNYFGYCKKEVKTQISYSANLYGLAEEEHSGGALAYYRVRLGGVLRANDHRLRTNRNTFADVLRLLGDRLEVHPEGYAVDRRYPNIVYLPETMSASLRLSTVSWQHEGRERSLKLLMDKMYIHPSGYSVYLEKHPKAVPNPLSDP